MQFHVYFFDVNKFLFKVLPVLASIFVLKWNIQVEKNNM